ncbi:MAG: hypothetical protein ABI268_08835 [Rhodanobacter sp.]
MFALRATLAPPRLTAECQAERTVGRQLRIDGHSRQDVAHRQDTLLQCGHACLKPVNQQVYVTIPSLLTGTALPLPDIGCGSGNVINSVCARPRVDLPRA